MSSIVVALKEKCLRFSFLLFFSHVDFVLFCFVFCRTRKLLAYPVVLKEQMKLPWLSQARSTNVPAKGVEPLNVTFTTGYVL